MGFSFLSRLSCTSLVLAVLWLPLAARAQAPVNDDPAQAICLRLSATCAPTIATTVGATTTAAATLGYTNPGCGVAISPKDVWFRFLTDSIGPGSTAAAITVEGTAAGQVRAFSANGAGGPFTAIGCAAGPTNNTQAPRLILEQLTPATYYYVCVSGYGSADTPGRFTICAAQVSPTNDLSVDAVQTLTQLPIPQGAPHWVRAVVTNHGLSPQLPITVTLTITGANPFSATQTIAALAGGGTTTVNFPGFTPTAAGTNTVAVSIPADGNTTNNSRTVTQVVNADTYSYADAGAAQSSRGFAPPTATAPQNNVFIGRFLNTAPLSVSHVRAYLVSGGGTTETTVGKTVYGVVMEPASGRVLARSADHVVTASELNSYVSLPLSSQVSLPAGAVFVGLVQTYKTGPVVHYYPLGTQPDGPGRTGAFYAGSATTPALFSDTGLSSRVRYMLEAVTVPASLCPQPAAATTVFSKISPTGFTATLAGAAGLTLSYSTGGGPSATVTSASSALAVNGLSPATLYDIELRNVCGGQTSRPLLGTLLTLPAPATYASLPLGEGFESTWQDDGAIQDRPGAHWRSSPSTGDPSWRRDDDGTSAFWAVPSMGAYRPVSSQGVHSARFHTYGAPTTSTGDLFLYVNMSNSPGPKQLTFDYVNVSGTDLLDVLVSNDGGATFSPTPVLTLGTSPAFASYSATLASTSPTTVIRFRATSDQGSTDMGIDNVRLAVLTDTRNEALAAMVGLAPNPAHGTFTLAVPAGSLGTASATLLNALGQAVQARQLRLPAAGGPVVFDMRGLASGVYSLQLQTSDTRVVKRVVIE
ncbi:T9SS type A sorting domain-containing protein [Hymenobacter sp. M29]|uniref:T9SS type A sorting domain-containing protein n=1 Tax=Hymenobacter mellowenesis TaxID=3063995 RepID=A0ABT9AH28_9BACT|nr:T9SS type A sorting domain-containing protein [Hymenobacter sp. M29]MDO7848672.1 T9SS type A sorting domain-containing protein [Hymenobacter sp. M29]